jgi:hypothetical protein
MGAVERCDYCGSTDIHCWQGHWKWCGSERCQVLHEWATYEPHFRLYYDPTPLQCTWGWLLSKLIWPLVLLTPASAVIDGKWWAVWIYAKSYWLEFRAGGEI